MKKIKKMIIWCSFFYKKKYLRGKYFRRDIVSIGWKWMVSAIFMQKIVGCNRHVPFPVSFKATIKFWENINFDIDNINIFQKPGCYFQADGATIAIGNGTQIANNVGIITANHDLNDITKHQVGKPVIIGENSWIGMNSVILPGVILGEHTIVGAGSVVTKSFSEGNCVIAGNPARLLKVLDKE
ncbi:MAG: DapH/DapD/GlmU-related protein [Oscillospiraceae bacterium]